MPFVCLSYSPHSLFLNSWATCLAIAISHFPFSILAFVVNRLAGAPHHFLPNRIASGCSRFDAASQRYSDAQILGCSILSASQFLSFSMSRCLGFSALPPPVAASLPEKVVFGSAAQIWDVAVAVAVEVALALALT